MDATPPQEPANLTDFFIQHAKDFAAAGISVPSPPTDLWHNICLLMKSASPSVNAFQLKTKVGHWCGMANTFEPPETGQWLPCSIWQLLIKGVQRMLQALNPDWPKRITPILGNCSIRGVVMGKAESFI